MIDVLIDCKFGDKDWLEEKKEIEKHFSPLST